MSHATYTDFAARYPASTAAQADVEALLPHASEAVTAVVLAPHDPTDPATAAVLANATCDQVAAWLETGDSNDLAGYATTVAMTLGDLTVGGQPAPISPRAVRTLRTGGLLNLYGW